MNPGFTRRQFLWSAAGLPALACLRPAELLAEQQRHSAPYLALEKFILPGNDEFPEEKLAVDVSNWLTTAVRSMELPVAPDCKGSSPWPARYEALAADVARAVFQAEDASVAIGWKRWVTSLGEIRRTQFDLLPDGLVRFEVASKKDSRLLHRVGLWKTSWEAGKLTAFSPVEEHVASAQEPFFRDVTAAAFENAPSFREQLSPGVSYWRARLDPATGIDIYGSNGIAVGDIDNDGFDEVYVCQPGGLPNRLYKFEKDGRVSDITEAWGVGLLDDTSAALFLDLRNIGRQDLVVLRGSGPVLFLNDGKQYQLRTDAFRFATAPSGAFTGMAAADFDRDGKLDLYLCCYVYFQSEAQYTYAVPYHDARNGPPNFLFHNRLNADGSGFLDDCTAETGMNENNDRFSFAPAWCDFNDDGWPDLYVANDFGRKNLYVNKEGRFRDLARSAGVEDIGPGMSASWFDYDGDGKADLYVANMWTAAGQRVVRDPQFAPSHASSLETAYQGHTMGNSLLRNRGDGTFVDVTAAEHAKFGRWAWASGGHDLDNDGHAEIFVTCGMLSNSSLTDLGSFFWRQVVAQSPVTAAPSSRYENGWNAINQFIREDYSWNGHEPNVLHVRRGDRYFDFSGVSGLDFADDSRAFAICDFDGDGRPDILLKSRMGPQVRVLQNNCARGNQSIAFRLIGTKSNRDAIGARVQVDGQTKWLEAGSGFLSQHSKRLLFGLGTRHMVTHVRVTWPSGLVQEFSNLSAGHTYTVVEGVSDVTSAPFRPSQVLPSRPVEADNQLALHDTWFLEPVPLPEKQSGPRLFVLDDLSGWSTERRTQYEIFRRYLFDWRTGLKTPIAFLLNESGHAVKVYGRIPSEEQYRRDLAELGKQSTTSLLPFRGFYIKPPKRDFFKFGAAFLWAGYPEQALPYLEQTLRQTPENARVLVLVGQIHWLGDRIDEAQKYYQQALAANPKNVSALLGLGDVADKRNQQQNAEAYYSKALQLDQQSAEAANGLGLALGKQGRLDEARQYFEQAITLRRDYPDAINNLGVLYIQSGKMTDAIAAFEYGIRVAPDEDILYLNLGRTYTRMGNFDKARGVMQRLLERKPDSPAARQALQELSGR